jgi:putative SOS response-associated peptidase YedK
MCGRYALAIALALLAERFGLYNVESTIILNLLPRYNLAPSQMAPIVTGGATRQLEAMRWGLIPSWAKDDSFASKMINARSETISEKPSFRNLIDRSRILIPSTGFFEWWQLPNGKREPVRIVLQDEPLFAFAGLSDTWRKPDGSELKTFTIITTEANELLKPVHERMPVILPRDAEEEWLDPMRKGTGVLRLLKSYPAEEMDFYPVSTIVNSPHNDSPACIERVPDSEK